MADEIILVAGVDYPKFKKDGPGLGSRTRWKLERVLGPGKWSIWPLGTNRTKMSAKAMNKLYSAQELQRVGFFSPLCSSSSSLATLIDKPEECFHSLARIFVLLVPRGQVPVVPLKDPWKNDYY